MFFLTEVPRTAEFHNAGLTAPEVLKGRILVFMWSPATLHLEAHGPF